MNITSFKLGLTNVFILENEKKELVIVDTSTSGQWRKFKKLFKEKGFEFSQVKYVVLTHCHQDHVGYLNKLMNSCDAKLILHEEAVERLALGHNPHTHGAPSKMLQFLSKISNKREAKFIPFSDKSRYLIFKSNEQYLKDNGFFAEIVYLPGHTKDSIGILCANGTMICGDALANIPLTKHFEPLVLEDIDQLKDSWDYILQNAKKILPSHGDALTVKKLKKQRKYLNEVTVLPIFGN